MATIAAPAINWGGDSPQAQGVVVLTPDIEGTTHVQQLNVIVSPSSAILAPADEAVGYATSG